MSSCLTLPLGRRTSPMLCSLNSAIVQSTGASSCFILYGRDKRMPRQLLLAPPRSICNVDNLVSTRLTRAQRIYHETHKLLHVSNSQMLSNQQKSARPKPVHGGQLAMFQKHIPNFVPKLGFLNILFIIQCLINCGSECVSGICSMSTKRTVHLEVLQAS